MVHERYRQKDDGRATAYSELFAKKTVDTLSCQPPASTLQATAGLYRSISIAQLPQPQ